ncbi:MAG TPA: glycine cleavage system protein GcvH [Acidimicrobiia bacterium]
MVPDDRRYTHEHEWVLEVGSGRVRVGITDYAQDALGDVVYVELPAIGSTFARGESMAEVESTKSVAEVYAPLAGTVAAVNESLQEHPELVNSDPYGAGWFLELDGVSEEEGLLAAEAYRELTG